MASEIDQEREDPSTLDVSGNDAATKLFMTIKSMSRVAYARNLRLRDEDIIVAIDGVLNDDDIISFNARFDQLLENQEKLLLTICRNEGPRNSDNDLLTLYGVERIISEQSLKPQNQQSQVQHQAYLQREHHR